MSAEAKRQVLVVDHKKKQVANQHDGSVSKGKVVGALLINLLLLP